MNEKELEKLINNNQKFGRGIINVVHIKDLEHKKYIVHDPKSEALDRRK